MLTLRCVSVLFKGKRLLSSLNLHLSPGELCVLVGRNGAGKSSLANALVADGRYVVGGVVNFRGANISKAAGLVIARLGVFLAFQHPVEIPGVMFIHFIKLAVSKLNAELLTTLPAKLSALTTFLNLSVGLLYRPVNVGFSGGEARMFELIQMVALEPKLCVLDEADSGLDRERVQCYASLVLAFAESSRVVLVITHSVSVVSMLAPDSVYYLTDAGFVNIRSALYIV
ncbi:FeS assembly ATPase SufC [Candidatus Hodgkinia cicadicola]|nr:FeS assembly ATPase SufC [Candidatus Hodgkinia cicadicola]